MDKIKIYKKNLDRLTEIEKKYPINSLVYKNINIIPLIRSYLLRNESMNNIKKKNRNFFLKLLTLLKIPKFYNEYIQLNKKINQLSKKKIELVFFSDHLFHYDQIKNKKVNLFIDPYYENLRNKYRSLKVEIVSNQFQEYSIKRNEPFYLKLFILNIKKYLNKSIFNIFTKIKNSALSKSKLKSGNFNKAIQDLDNIIFDADIIELFLKKINPKIVFLTCYYTHKNLSIILACKKLKIPTVDIQHGGHELYHLMYSNWKKMPKNGFELLPDYFWIWGDNQKNDGIFNNLKTKHRYVVGGKSQLEYWKKNKLHLSHKSKNDKKEFLIKKKKYKKIILFCSTYTKVPKVIFKLIKKSPKDWLWLIRTHPRHGNLKKFKSQFRSNNFKNLEINFSSSVDLDFLLNNVSNVIVEFSSIIYDALYFNVPSIVLQKNKKLFKKKIKNKNLNFTLDENKIFDLIKKNYKFDNNDKLISGKKFAIKAVDQIIKISNIN